MKWCFFVLKPSEVFLYSSMCYLCYLILFIQIPGSSSAKIRVECLECVAVFNPFGSHDMNVNSPK